MRDKRLTYKTQGDVTRSAHYAVGPGVNKDDVVQELGAYEDRAYRYRWHPGNEIPKAHDDGFNYLVIISGKCGSITFDDASELAAYDEISNEWILESFSEFIGFQVVAWRLLDTEGWEDMTR